MAGFGTLRPLFIHCPGRRKPLLGWRLEQSEYVPWLAKADGWWHSRSLDITLRPTQPFMTIRDRHGRRISLPGEVFEHEEQLERELTEAQQRIAELERQVRGPQGHQSPG